MSGSRRNNLPRKSSPKGMDERLEIRRKNYQAEVPKGGAGTQHHIMPGSRNPRKH